MYADKRRQKAAAEAVAATAPKAASAARPASKPVVARARPAKAPFPIA
jgi:hypothetical protein